MPETVDVDFVAVDEVQLATDLERGHFFTDRILNLRGKHETMLLGADTMTGALRDLLPGLNVITRPGCRSWPIQDQKKSPACQIVLRLWLFLLMRFMR